MKFLILFALFVAVNADVSHLSRTYLPPALSAPAVSYSAPALHHNTYSAPAIHYSAPSFVPEPPPIVHQTYSSPAVHHHHHIEPAPVNEYLPPGEDIYTGPPVQTPYYAPPLSYSVPGIQQTLSAPAVQHSAHATQHHYVAPSVSYLAPVVQQSYSAPAVSYSGSSFGTQYGSNGGYIYRKH